MGDMLCVLSVYILSLTSEKKTGGGNRLLGNPRLLQC